uniref:Internal head protein n=1 Tax=Pseudomonas phage RVTF4 TaxID=3236931 RepID=A0AB39CD57_9VIRU
MAKKSLSKMIASLEDQDGTAQVVDASNPSADLKDEVETPKRDAVQSGDNQPTDDQVQADMKDFTAMDKASIAQGEALHKKFERLADAEASTEAYVGILRGAVKKRQGIDGATAVVIAQDLKSQYPQFFKTMTASLEAISMEEGEGVGYSSSSKEVALTENAAKEGEGKLAKLGNAVKEGWKKFMAWLKERWLKLKGFFEKVFGRAKTVKEANQKLLANPKPEAAAEVAKMLGAPRTGTVEKEPAKEAPAAQVDPQDRDRVSAPNIGVLSGKDPMDVKKINLKVLKDMNDNWMKPTAASVAAVLKLLMGDETKTIQAIDMQAIAQEIIKVDYTPVEGLLPSNYVLEGTDNKWGFKMVQHEQPEQIDSVEFYGPEAVKRLLATNDELLDIALEMGETWVKVQQDIEKITAEKEYLMDLGKAGEMKKWMTEYLTTLSNSDVVPLTKLIIQACTARLLACGNMTAPK